ncbi:hypothetical protein UVI_02052050 [Ustilaginoidea virens]|uniref:Aminoglycoside phosphotransferase domain-containing protein n=1 Tax=Ustilaginoidea virens TaxID=1159556 RepID=A0A1B5L237_USTVR|nr:hypothetical protein UVI_02052050 [Ustilaginoidea virens]
MSSISSFKGLVFSPEYEFRYNNYLFKVDLSVTATSTSFPGSQPGTVPAPSDGITSLIVKLSNGNSEANITNRVENDVAAQYLVRQSMERAGLNPLAAAVYAWAPANTRAGAEADAFMDEKDFGWTMMEVKPGVDFDTQFSDLDPADKEKCLQQVAMILKAVQDAKLPETVTMFGGLTFNSTGEIISGEPPLLKLSPVETYVEWKFGRLRKLMQEAAESPVIQGWKPNGVGARLEKFLAAGGPELVLANVDQRQKSLVHGDFTTNNMLFDKDTKEISALVDFDWCTVSNPLDEFLYPNGLGCNITFGQTEIDLALLSGDFDQPPDTEEVKSAHWETARAWNAALDKVGATSPSRIKGARQIYDMLRLKDLLCPQKLSNASALARLDDEKKAELRAKTEADIVEWLDKHGF